MLTQYHVMGSIYIFSVCLVKKVIHKLYMNNYNCPFYVDNARDEYILPEQLDFLL